MIKKLKRWHYITFILTSALIFLLHEAYKYTGFLPLSAISAVNESVWEHVKIVYFALLIGYLLESLIFAKNLPNFWCAKVKALVVGPLFLLIAHYTYAGSLGYSVMIIDILLGILSLLIAQIVSWRNSKQRYAHTLPLLCILTILILTFIFVIFTYYPLKIDLFRDPLTSRYGLYNK